ncbi:MAG: hypothetical protein RID09_20395 [Coleofasciculus sp. G1-WW12-02]|uniref:hypothetical protein n=1 Tax=Coleofasciculus sp. G1-WW12-02 TaxID=3068483 RepID=UPI0032F64A84
MINTTEIRVGHNLSVSFYIKDTLVKISFVIQGTVGCKGEIRFHFQPITMYPKINNLPECSFFAGSIYENEIKIFGFLENGDILEFSNCVIS